MNDARHGRPSARSQRTRWIALASAVLLALGACGGGGGESGGHAAPLQTAMAAAPQPAASATPLATWYRVTQLPVSAEAGFVGRNGLNAAGQVVGTLATATGRGFFFHDGTTTTLHAAPPPSATGQWTTSVREITGINASGQVVGSYDFENLADPRLFGAEAFSWSPAGGFVRITPSMTASGHRVNDAGQIAGSRASPLGLPGSEGFLWSPGAGLRSDFGPDTQLAEASVVNASGLIAGHGVHRGTFGALRIDPAAGRASLLVAARDYAKVVDINGAGAVAGAVLTAGDRFHAFLAEAEGGGVIDLGPIIGAGHDSFAQDLNERGELVLQVRRFDRPPETRTAAYFWSREHGAIEMKPPAEVHAIPVALNNHGLAVGYHDVWNGAEYAGSRAFAWTRESGLVDLAGRVQNPPPGFHLHAAMAVNDDGVIVASSDAGLVLLTPLTAPPMGEAPVVGAIVSEAAVPAGSSVAFSAGFTDADAADTHTATWTWGDGSAPQAGSVSGGAGAGRVTGSHRFAAAGVYTVTLRVTDSARRSAEVSRELVVHDRSAGFVKGGGWFASPAGAHPAQPGAAGQAHFNFLARHRQAGKSRKEHSQASFSFRTGELHFRSKRLDTLRIDGAQARLEGEGSLDGQGGHRFLLAALDGAAGQADRLRIRIWRRDARSGAEHLVYDNQPEPGGEAPAIRGGQILVRGR